MLLSQEKYPTRVAITPIELLKKFRDTVKYGSFREKKEKSFLKRS